MIRRALPLVAILAACSTKPRGQVMLAIDSDMTPGVDFDRVQIEVRVPSADADYLHTFDLPGLDGRFPATYGIVEGEPSTVVQLRIISGNFNKPGNRDVGQPVHLREIQLNVPDDRTVLLRVRLEWLCSQGTKLQGADNYVEGQCDEGQTCLAGQCVDWNVDTSMLPTFDERDVFGGGTSDGGGDCFDTLACFDASMGVQPDAACSIPKPARDANVGIVPDIGQGGICTGSTCVVPLDRGAPYGWTEVNGRIVLPKAVCDTLGATPMKPLGSLHAREILITTKCPTKMPSKPTCGGWSAIRPGTTDASIPVPSDAASD